MYTGSVIFNKGPNIENIHGQNLRNLISEIWMLDQPLNLPGNFVTLQNITLNQLFELHVR